MQFHKMTNAVAAERKLDGLPRRFSLISLMLVGLVLFTIFMLSNKLQGISTYISTHTPKRNRPGKGDQMQLLKGSSDVVNNELHPGAGGVGGVTLSSMTTFDPSVPIEEELEIVLSEQQQMIKEEMHAYQYPNGLYGHNVSKLENLLMSEGGQPLRSVIFSTWRSGSTFLGDVLNSHPGNYYHYEPLLHFEIVQVRTGELAQKAVEIVRNLLHCNYSGLDDYLSYGPEHFWLFTHNRRLWEQCQRHERLCWKPMFLNPFCSLFPVQSMKTVRLRLQLAKYLLDDKRLNIRVLHLVRDPRGTMQSRRHRDWCPDHPDCWDPTLLCDDMVADYHSARELLKEYPGRVKVMRYEDLSVEPYSGVKSVLQFFGLQYHPKINEFLDTHTKVNIGGVSSTFRDSKSAPFHWKKDLSYAEIVRIQEVCMDALQLWDYRPVIDESHLDALDPIQIPLDMDKDVDKDAT